MFVMGETFPLSYVRITCTGQGAVVSTDPSSLDFGRVKVLEEKKMDFELINDSPIPTQFARENQENSSWIMEPEFGDLLPHESKTITIKVFLVNGGVYKERIMLSVIDSRTIHVDVKVIGYGCSVIFTPQIFPVFDWGLLFSHHHINRTITLMNRGTVEYQMIFINEPDIRFRRGQLLTTKSSKFKVEPQIVHIPAGETREVNCRLFWEVNEHVVEKWYVFGQLQDAGKRELIDTSSFTITLTEPYIVFNKKMLEFRVDRCPTEDKLQQTDELLVTNQSNLDLNVHLSIKEPFHLVTSKKKHVQTMKLVLVDKISTKITVFFSFDTNNKNYYSKSYEEVLLFEYREHPNRDKIICKGYVNYPNILIEPNDFIINCELGCSAEKILTLTNNGPVSVIYKFLWLENSIDIKRDTPVKLECPGCPSQEQLESKKDIFVATETGEEPCISDRQNESGNEQSIAPPVNSPVSEKQETTDGNPERNNYPEFRREIRQFLLEIVEEHFEKDDDLIVLQNMSDDPPRIDYINEVLQIIPNEGTVLPYSVQRVHVGFHGFEWLQIKATAVCQILRGPTENVHIFARADNVRYDIDNDVIDFGQQLFLQRQRKCITLKNICTIAFEFEIKDAVKFFDEEFNRFNLHPLKIEPVSGCVNPESCVQFQVDHVAMTLGRIDHYFQLEIAHLMPIIIKIVAYGVFPQVYLCIPKGKLHQHHSIELEYSAIQSLTEDLADDTVEKVVAEKKNDLFETDMDILAAEDWCVISHKETFPRIMDIDMAVERLCAKKFIDENSYILMQHATIQKKEPIPQLFSCEYIIDMNYVIIERIAHYSANIINYGPWIVNMRMKTMGKRDYLGKRGIVVQLMKNTNVPVGDYAVLQVTWYPTQEKFSEKSTNVKYTIYIEVSHGCTIPVTIKGTVTYPYVTVNTKFLDFQDVVVGECLVLNILIKNE
ncbi:hydrocephalus-inducing protein homolog [Apis cerana]|uniref:hydrocephalus-inducing protein homolog n=1 Tax=Apis cerana TaxID=7461 RepID=UPI002B237FE7|nr:hydrocephalus-inducing protein homolog [Apis cerana]